MWNVTIGTLLTIILVVAFIAVVFLAALYSTPAKSWIYGIVTFVTGFGKFIDLIPK